jgi:hypothetical protein
MFVCFLVFYRLSGKHLAFLMDVALNPSVKLHALHESVVSIGVIVLLGLCNPPCRGRGEPTKPRLWYSLVWIPCCDTVSEKPRSRSRVGSVASDF